MRTGKGIFLSNFQKKTSAITVVVFFFHACAIAPLPLEAEEVPAAARAGLNFEKIRIPARLGQIEERFQGNGGAHAMIVQDAHSVSAAQQSIRGLIDYFEKKYGLKLVAVEGARSRFEPAILRSFPDKDSLAKILSEYSGRAELTGPAAASILNEAPASLYHGLEDWKIYEAGLESYLEALEREPELSGYATREEALLKTEKEKHYSPRLLKVDRALGRFAENKGDLEDLLKLLGRFQKPPKGTQLGMLYRQMLHEGAKDPVMERQAGILAKSIREGLQARGPDARMSFEREYQKFKTSEITPEEFGFFLKKIARRERISVKFPEALKRGARRQQQLRQIEGTRLFDELEDYAAVIKKSLFRSPGDETLDRQSKALGVLKKLIRLELTREEWAEIDKAGLPELLRRAFRNTSPPPALFFDSHLGFYRNALKRDRIFSENFLKLLGSVSGPKAGMLVVGGFHAEGLAREFRKAGISYTLIIPSITALPEKDSYRDQMSANVSWKEYLVPDAEGRIHLYDAFIRAVRDRLLRQTADPGLALKHWRDNLIRDLAREGRLEDASRNLRLLDETRKDGAPATDLRGKWIRNVERFVRRLRRLENQGRFDQENIARLLKPAAMGSSVVTGVLDPTATRLISTVRRSEVRVDPPAEPEEIPSTLLPKQDRQVPVRAEIDRAADRAIRQYLQKQMARLFTSKGGWVLSNVKIEAIGEGAYSRVYEVRKFEGAGREEDILPFVFKLGLKDPPNPARTGGMDVATFQRVMGDRGAKTEELKLPVFVDDAGRAIQPFKFFLKQERGDRGMTVASALHEAIDRDKHTFEEARRMSRDFLLFLESMMREGGEKKILIDATPDNLIPRGRVMKVSDEHFLVRVNREGFFAVDLEARVQNPRNLFTQTDYMLGFFEALSPLMLYPPRVAAALRAEIEALAREKVGVAIFFNKMIKAGESMGQDQRENRVFRALGAYFSQSGSKREQIAATLRILGPELETLLHRDFREMVTAPSAKMESRSSAELIDFLRKRTTPPGEHEDARQILIRRAREPEAAPEAMAALKDALGMREGKHIRHDGVREETAHILGELGAAGRDILLDALANENNPPVRIGMIKALQATGAVEDRTVRTAVQIVKGGDEEAVRAQALLLLRAHSGAALQEILRTWHEGQPHIRRQMTEIAEILAPGDLEAAAIIFRRASADPDQDVARRGISGFEKIGAVKDLAGVLETSKKVDLKKHAAEALGRITEARNDPEQRTVAVRELLKAVSGRSRPVRIAAIHAIREFFPLAPEDAEALKQKLLKNIEREAEQYGLNSDTPLRKAAQATFGMLTNAEGNQKRSEVRTAQTPGEDEVTAASSVSRVLVHQGETVVSDKPGERFEAGLGCCLAVAGLNPKTGQRALAHLLPSGHTTLLTLGQAFTVEDARNRYLEKLLSPFEGPDWRILVVAYGKSAAPESDYWIKREDVENFLSRQKSVVKIGIHEGLLEWPENKDRKDVLKMVELDDQARVSIRYTKEGETLAGPVINLAGEEELRRDEPVASGPPADWTIPGQIQNKAPLAGRRITSVLAVESEPQVAAFLEMTLKAALPAGPVRPGGPEIVMLPNGREAWALMASREFDLIILDRSLAEFTGSDLLLAVPESQRKTPLILTDASRVPPGPETGKSQNIFYLAKPYGLREVRALVRFFEGAAPAAILNEYDPEKFSPAAKSEVRTPAVMEAEILEEARALSAMLYANDQRPGEHVKDMILSAYFVIALNRPPVLPAPPAEDIVGEWEKYLPHILALARRHPELDPDIDIDPHSLRYERSGFIQGFARVSARLARASEAGVSLHPQMINMLYFWGLRNVPEVRAAAIDALSRIKGHSPERLMLTLYRMYENPEAGPMIRGAILQALARLNDFSKLQELIEESVEAGGKDPGFIRDLVVALGAIPTPPVHRFLEDLLALKARGVSQAVLQALRQHGSAEALTKLSQTAFSDDSALAVAALAELAAYEETHPEAERVSLRIASAHLNSLSREDQVERKDLVLEALKAVRQAARLDTVPDMVPDLILTLANLAFEPNPPVPRIAQSAEEAFNLITQRVIDLHTQRSEVRSQPQGFGPGGAARPEWIGVSVHSENSEKALKLYGELEAGGRLREKITVSEPMVSRLPAAIKAELERYQGEPSVSLFFEGQYLDRCCTAVLGGVFEFAAAHPEKKWDMNFPVDLLRYEGKMPWAADSPADEKIEYIARQIQMSAVTAGHKFRIYVDGEPYPFEGETATPEEAVLNVRIWQQSSAMAEWMKTRPRSEARLLKPEDGFGRFEIPRIELERRTYTDSFSKKEREIITGLKQDYFIRTSTGREIFLADHHQKAALFWMEAFRNGLIPKMSRLFHMDGHPDDVVSGRAFKAMSGLDPEALSRESSEDLQKLVSAYFRIDTFIAPLAAVGFLDAGQWHYLAELDNNAFRQRLEWAGQTSSTASPFGFTYGPEKSGVADILGEDLMDIVDLDLDIFQNAYLRLKKSGMGEGEIREKLKSWASRSMVPILARAKALSIVTSPDYIDQELAAELMNHILEELNNLPPGLPPLIPFEENLEYLDVVESRRQKAAENLKRLPPGFWDGVAPVTFEAAQKTAGELYPENTVPEFPEEYAPLVELARKAEPRLLTFWRLGAAWGKGGDQARTALFALLGLHKNNAGLTDFEKISLSRFAAGLNPAQVEKVLGEDQARAARSEVRSSVLTIAKALSPEESRLPVSPEELESAARSLSERRIPIRELELALKRAVEIALDEILPQSQGRDLELRSAVAQKMKDRLLAFITAKLARAEASAGPGAKITLGLEIPSMGDPLEARKASGDYTDILTGYFKGRIERLILSGRLENSDRERIKDSGITLGMERNPAQAKTFILSQNQSILPLVKASGESGVVQNKALLPIGLSYDPAAQLSAESMILGRFTQVALAVASALSVHTQTDAAALREELLRAMLLSEQYAEETQGVIRLDANGFPVVDAGAIEALLTLEIQAAQEFAQAA